MSNTWDTLYEAAKKVLNPRKISEWMEAGGVAAAVETAEGNMDYEKKEVVTLGELTPKWWI